MGVVVDGKIVGISVLSLNIGVLDGIGKGLGDGFIEEEAWQTSEQIDPNDAVITLCLSSIIPPLTELLLEFL